MEFLFNNPFLFIILIGIISSFFKKKKEDPEKKRKVQQGGQQKRSRYDRPFEEIKDIFKEVTRTHTEESKPPAREISKGTYIENNIENQTKLNQVETIGQTVWQDQPQPQSSSPFQHEKTAVKELEINASHIVDGIIWSEILGPPRAKNPYLKKK